MSDTSGGTAGSVRGGPVVVTGANGFVGSFVCRALAAHEVEVRALVRREGTAPTGPGITEHVGEFDDPDVASRIVDGAAAVVTTVAPMGEDQQTQHEVSVEGTRRLATAARDAGVARLVHVSTAAVYDRSPGVGDVDESGSLVDDDAGAYAVTKRDADAALAGVDGITRVLVRPPAILGPGPTSVWNTLRPAEVRDDPGSVTPNPDKTLAWVHVVDLARFLADVAVGAMSAGDDPGRGPVTDEAVAVNVAAPGATWRDWLSTVADAVGVEPMWSDEPAWTGQIVNARARAWGWAPTVDLPTALAELHAGLAAPRAERVDPDPA